MNKKLLKSIGAVFAGLLAIFVLSTATDIILEKSGIFPPPEKGLFITWMLVLALIYRCIYAILGCYIAAELAPDRPMRHALILGWIGVALSTIGTIVGWHLSAHWYPISLVITALPCAWLGGKLQTR